MVSGLLAKLSGFKSQLWAWLVWLNEVPINNPSTGQGERIPRAAPGVQE